MMWLCLNLIIFCVLSLNGKQKKKTLICYDVQFCNLRFLFKGEIEAKKPKSQGAIQMLLFSEVMKLEIDIIALLNIFSTDDRLTITPKIVNGMDSADGQAPYQGSLQIKQKHSCGCAIINA